MRHEKERTHKHQLRLSIVAAQKDIRWVGVTVNPCGQKHLMVKDRGNQLCYVAIQLGWCEDAVY